MNLYEQLPYWLIRDGIVSSYPSLHADVKADVAIIGAGVSAALTAWHLRASGRSIVVLDRRHVGMGSTAASTAFLQYEIDTPLTKLSKMVGEKNAVDSYRLCRQAIYDIEDICKKFKPAFEFSIVPSLQHASYRTHVGQLREEYALRKKHSFNVEWLESDDLAQKFRLDAPAGILSADGGQLDAYLFTHALFRDFLKHGHVVYNNTAINHIRHNKDGIRLVSSNGAEVQAKKIVIACGYESLKYLPIKIAEVQTTYALVSEALPNEYFWHGNSLIWETASPYTYFRVVSENRILIGGRDDPYHRPHISPSTIDKKSKMLVNAFHKRMPHIPLKPDFSWAGAFAVTSDGLPYIGGIKQIPNTYFALGFGGNGITFSVIAAQILKDMILGKSNIHAHLFDFSR